MQQPEVTGDASTVSTLIKANSHCDVITAWQQCLLSGLSWSCPPLHHSSRKLCIHKCLWQVACGSNGHDICPASGNSYPCLSDRGEQEERMYLAANLIKCCHRRQVDILDQPSSPSLVTFDMPKQENKAWKTKVINFVLKGCKKHKN